MAELLEYSADQLIPTQKDCSKIVTAMIEYEAAKKRDDYETWKSDNKNWNKTPWGISWNIGKAAYDKKIAKGWKATKQADAAFRFFIIAVIIDWKDLIQQLKKCLHYWGYTAEDIKTISKDVWCKPETSKQIIDMCEIAFKSITEEPHKSCGETLKEAVEKHDALNSKLFTKDEVLKDKVRDKMLEIVDEFLADLKEQDIKIKVDDILLIGSNASYNYTKDSDIDLHILANAKAADYSNEIANALYSAYRSLFNKQLDIKLFDIPLEIFVETEESTRVSNGVYSVKKNKWVKKPVQEDIPEYDTKALDKLVDKWETKCKDLIADIKSDKLNDEKKVVKMLEDIYEKLRKNGIAKGEYSIENLTFKELRNKGYLDKLKDFRNELISKRLSLEEKLDRQAYIDTYNQIARAAGEKPYIQDNGIFFIYNIKSGEKDLILRKLKQLPCVVEVHANETSKYDYSNVLDLALNKIPNKYYSIKGRINL